MYGKIREDLIREIKGVRDAGLYKAERVIEGPQGAEITVGGGTVLNFCANNYLGLSSHPELIKAAHEVIDEWGYGLSSVRFICGTQTIHKSLEKKVSEFLGTEDTILYAACFDANGGVFEPFLDKECAIIADQLNHASIIDGVRLCKAQRYVYAHNQMGTGEYEHDGRAFPGLEARLIEAKDAKYRMICTDGVFSMDGTIAQLDRICDLADKYDALVLVDDSHATGFMGKTGRGTHEYRGVVGRIDLITTTFGKALGGASGGCTSGRAEMIEWLRQKSRPYLFSNTVAPAVVGATIKVLDILTGSTELRDRLERNQRHFREKMTAAGFEILKGDHPIVPIMFSRFENDAAMATQMADDLLKEGIYVIGFSYPVVPKGRSRIRVQLSAAHDIDQVNQAVDAFTRVGKKLGVIS